MELGKRLQQARQEAGLSQKQLCGEKITRNMLSQIEHGTARPSMATLQYLAARLGKSVGYFLEEATAPNVQGILNARQAWKNQDAKAVLDALAECGQDDITQQEYWLLTAFATLYLAEEALEQGKPVYARMLLEQAAQAEEKTLYSQVLTEKRLVLQYRAGMGAEQLPDNTWECILRGQWALEKGDPENCVRYLQGAENLQNADLQRLMGKAYQALGRYENAVASYLLAEKAFPQVAENLEICYRELGDYKKAYEYACKQRMYLF